MPFTLPGEIVLAEPSGKRGEGVAADLVEVLAPSRHREPPPCAHFGVCGGCSLQHWRADAYTAWKVGLIERALQQHGVVVRAFESPLAGLSTERRRVDFVLRRQGRRVLAGFHQRADQSVVDVGTCVVARPALSALLAPLRAALAEILPEGAAADAVVNETDGGLDMLIRPHKRLDLSLERREALAALAERADLARLSWGARADAEPVVTRRTPFLSYGDVTIVPPPGVFLQATRRAESAMREAVASWLDGAKRVADLFAGVGALTAGRKGRITLYENDSAANAAAEAAGHKLGGNRMVAVRRDLFRNPLTGLELDAFDAAVLDPPRAGAAAQVSEIARSKLTRVVYASCDPATFARDARVLQEAGYRLEKLMPIDQFFWSVHVELIALFAK